MFPRALRIARIAGIDVRIDPTWVIIAVLVVWSFLARFATGGRPVAVATVMSLAATVGFFGSVLAHELAHALEAGHRDLEVHGITLFLFGGVTEMDMRAQRPRDEFSVAAVGPWASLALAAAFGLVTTGIDEYVPRLAEVSAITGVLGWINLGLALFNIVPGAPLDGGRVLRAALWAIVGERHRAAMLAARAGQGVAILLLGFAVYTVLNRPSGSAGAVFSALWLGFIGWFMFNAASRERGQAKLLRVVEGRTAGVLVSGNQPTLQADAPLALVDRQLTTTPEERVYPVVDADGAEGPIVGGVTVDAIEAVEPFDRGFRTVRDVMVPARELPTEPEDAPLLAVLIRLQHEPMVGVVGPDGALRGIIDVRRAEAALQRLQRLGPADSARLVTPAGELES